MASTQTYVLNETPTRISSRVYSLANLPILNTQSIFVNNVLQNVNSRLDYAIQDKVITFTYDISLSDVVVAKYMTESIIGEGFQPKNPISSASRKELIHWCLRKLGAPVIDINVDEEQIEDRINEALRYFRDYHFDGVERMYLHHQLTPSSIAITAPYTQPISQGTILTGNTSKASGYISGVSQNNSIIFYRSTGGCFIPGETVTIQDTGNTVTIVNSSTAVAFGNIDNGFVDLGPRVLSVTNILPQQTSIIGGNLGGMFDFQYQFALNNMFNLASTDLVTYDVYQRYITMWEFMFRGQKGIRFNRKTDRLYFDMSKMAPGQWVVFECWVALDPSIWTEIYSDEFVREYAYSLIKMQWGTNLKKFSGISLPGGTTLNGQQIYDEAKAELEVLRERVKKEFELPPEFIVG